MKQLIPIAYLNESCFLSLNEDDKKYSMCLKMSQEDLSDVLGGQFYEEIESQYPSTLTPDNGDLYEGYLKDFLAWKTYFNYLKFANVNATPTGVRTFTDENSSLATEIQMNDLEKNVLAQASKYKYKIINFLTLEKSKDRTKYPLYKQNCKEEFSFGITSIDKTSNTLFKVNKSIVANE